MKLASILGIRGGEEQAGGQLREDCPWRSSGRTFKGKAVATAEKMREYVKKKNPAVAQSVLDMVGLMYRYGW